MATTLRTVTAPASLTVKRCSSVPAIATGWVPGLVSALASVSPPVVATSRLIGPLARMMRMLPAGTVSAEPAAGAGSPGRSPARITGGLPV